MGRTLAWVIAATVLPATFVAQADPPATTKPAGMYDLAAVTGIARFSGSKAAQCKLAANGFVVTEEQFRQIYLPYVAPEGPVFITTDSAWQTYHVLLEEGVRYLEETQALRLRRFARGLVDATAKRGKGDLLDYYAAVGLALQDEAYAKALAKDSQAAATVTAIRAGTGRVNTPIGFAVAAQQFRPVSFYTQSEPLRTYFTARQWYGLVLFRLRHKAETQLAMELAMLIDADGAQAARYALLNGAYDTLLARPADGDAGVYLAAARKVLGKELTPAAVAGQIDAMGRDLADRLAAPKGNDLWLSPEQYARFPQETKGFRLLPPRELPCSALFHNTTAPRITGRAYPGGLDYLAASPELRSDAARRALQLEETPAVAKAILKAPCPPLPESLHGQAMKALALLQKPLPEAAPAALRTAAWSDKQLATQLAAWSQQRHTWALHAKISVGLFGGPPTAPGIVEPYPEFYEALGALSDATARQLETQLASESMSFARAGEELLLDLKDYRKYVEAQEPEAEDTPARNGQVQRVADMLREYREIAPRADGPDALEQLARRCAQGKATADDEALMARLYRAAGTDSPARLRLLAGICRQLRDIAQKQLAGKAVSVQDEKFIRRYGDQIAQLHGEFGGAGMGRDDFPIIAPIFMALEGGTDQVLYAGVSRPHAIFVIAEVAGEPVLHRGAVLSYREFRRPVDQPIDDEAWVAMVRAGLTPPPPAFTRSFQAIASPADVVAILREGNIYAAINDVPGREITRELLAIAATGRGIDPRMDSAKRDPFVRQTGRLGLEWVLNALSDRVEAEFAGEMLGLVQKHAPKVDVSSLAWGLAKTPLDKHRKAVLDLLYDPDPKAAEAGSRIVANQPNLLDLPALVAATPKRPEPTRKVYCSLLADLPPAMPGVAAGLAAALEDPSGDIRKQAAQAAGNHSSNPDPVILQGLFNHLKDPSPEVVRAVVNSLGHMPPAQAGPVLLRELTQLPPNWQRDVNGGNLDQFWVYQDLTAALGGLAYAPAAGVLEKECQGSGWGPAATALGRINRPRAIELLRPRLAGPDARWALPILSDLSDPEQEQRLARIAMDPKALPEMFEQAVELLTYRHGEAGRRPVVAELEKRLAAGGDLRVFQALQTLDRNGDKKRLWAVLRNPRTAHLAAQAIEDLSGENREETLLQVLRDRGSTAVARAVALGGLAGTAIPEDALAGLIPLLKEEWTLEIEKVDLQTGPNSSRGPYWHAATQPADSQGICRQAADAIAHNLRWDRDSATDVLTRARAWAQGRMKPPASGPAQ